MSDSTPSLSSLSSFDRHLLAERLRIQRSNQTLLSAPHVRADVQPHQWAAVQQALHSTPPRVLLADDGDLGRRTQAMALLKELALRGQADRVLVIPASNADAEWGRTMHRDFGLDMKWADHSWVDEHRQDPNLWRKPQQRIVVPQSMLTCADRGRDLVCAPWDVVVVEKALDRLQDHERAESRAAYAAEAVRNAQAKIFCCEQPHRKGPAAFWDLIELLDPPGMMQRGEGGLQFPIVRRSPATVVDANPTPPELSYGSVAVELSGAEHAFHTRAAAYIRNAYPVMNATSDNFTGGMTGGMTGVLMAEPMAFAGALEERVDLITVNADIPLSEEAETLLAGEWQAERSEEELRAIADDHPNAMFEDELNWIANLVERAQTLHPHATVVTARTLIDQIRSDEPDTLIIVRARYPCIVRALQDACADMPWHDQVVMNDSFYQKEPHHTRVQAELDTKEAPVLVTLPIVKDLDYGQAEAVHVINLNLSPHPTQTRYAMRRMQRSTGTRKVMWHDLHMSGTREGRLLAAMHEQVLPLYKAAIADSTVAGVFDRLEAWQTVVQAVCKDTSAAKALQALQSELDTRTDELHAWQDSSFFACSSFDADDKQRIEAMLDAA